MSRPLKRIFVVGCSRGGTTLIQSVLGSHSAIATLPETSFFQRMVAGGEPRQFGRMARNCHPLKVTTSRIRQALTITGPDIIKSFETLMLATKSSIPPISGRTTYRTAATHFVTIMDRFAYQHGKQAWVEKTPSHLHYIDEIETYIPDARFIHIVRDGVAVVASLRSAASKYPNAHWPILYDTLDRCIARWNECVRCTLKHAPKPNHLVLRLERFIASPTSQSKAICNFLGLPWESGMVSSRHKLESSICKDREAWKSNVTKDISPSNQTQPDDILTTGEQSYIKARLTSLSNIDRYAVDTTDA